MLNWSSSSKFTEFGSIWKPSHHPPWSHWRSQEPERSEATIWNDWGLSSLPSNNLPVNDVNACLHVISRSRVPESTMVHHGPPHFRCPGRRQLFPQLTQFRLPGKHWWPKCMLYHALFEKTLTFNLGPLQIARRCSKPLGVMFWFWAPRLRFQLQML